MSQYKQEILLKIRDYFYEFPLELPSLKETRSSVSSCRSSLKKEGESDVSPSSMSLSTKKDLAPHKEVDKGEWGLLQEKVLSCHLCSLSRSRTHAVFGSGNPQSILYVVGEAPGGDEDIQGKPFVGRSGQLLTKMLQAIAIQREDIFITNIVKCRPPSNRDPLPDEIQSCTPYLEAQIQQGRPKVILALGRFAGSFFVDDPKASMASLRGQFHETRFGCVFATYHPSAVLRSPNQRRPVVWEDLKILAHYLNKVGFYTKPEQNQLLKKNKVL